VKSPNQRKAQAGMRNCFSRKKHSRKQKRSCHSPGNSIESSRGQQRSFWKALVRRQQRPDPKDSSNNITEGKL
jgi:hypothetical protein